MPIGLSPGGMPSRLNEYGGWYFRVYIRVRGGTPFEGGFEGGAPSVESRRVGCPPAGVGEVGSLLGSPLTAGGKSLLPGVSGTGVPLLTSATTAPGRPSHAGAGVLPTKALPRLRSLEGAHHPKGGGLAQGLGITLFAFGGAYWPLATAHSDPLWARTSFGCVRGGVG